MNRGLKQREQKGRRKRRREKETKADIDKIYQHSRNMGWVYH